MESCKWRLFDRNEMWQHGPQELVVILLLGNINNLAKRTWKFTGHERKEDIILHPVASPLWPGSQPCPYQYLSNMYIIHLIFQSFTFRASILFMVEVRYCWKPLRYQRKRPVTLSSAKIFQWHPQLNAALYQLVYLCDRRPVTLWIKITLTLCHYMGVYLIFRQSFKISNSHGVTLPNACRPICEALSGKMALLKNLVLR